jgi:hypothetical protein
VQDAFSGIDTHRDPSSPASDASFAAGAAVRGLAGTAALQQIAVPVAASIAPGRKSK